MYNYEKYANRAALLNANYTYPHAIDENSFLFTLVFHLRFRELKGMILSSVGDMATHLPKLREIKNDKVFYNNVLPGDGLPQDQFTSRDQLMAYIIYSLVFEKSDKVACEVWGTLKRNFFTYDNTTGKFNVKRVMLPHDLIFFGFLANSALCYLLMPLYYLFGLITVFQSKPSKSSGTQLLYVRSTVDTHILAKPMMKLYEYILNKRWKKLGFKDWKEGIFNSYYPEDYPTNLLTWTVGE